MFAHAPLAIPQGTQLRGPAGTLRCSPAQMGLDSTCSHRPFAQEVRPDNQTQKSRGGSP